MTAVYENRHVHTSDTMYRVYKMQISPACVGCVTTRKKTCPIPFIRIDCTYRLWSLTIESEKSLPLITETVTVGYHNDGPSYYYYYYTDSFSKIRSAAGK